MAEAPLETLPALCNLCQLPLGTALDRHHLRPDTTTRGGRLYHFCCAPCQWIFGLDPERYAGHLNVVDRFLALSSDTMREVAAKVAIHSVGRRLPLRPGATYEVLLDGKVIPEQVTLGELIVERRLPALSWFDVRWREG
jgi:hypothetical protein